ncbi:DM13 domain-containing protein [Patescibacteria group bacterium]|jgi:hypothetical protein|nr:DM13 domain-containing protein [Patescibacteria group bacterium]
MKSQKMIFVLVGLLAAGFLVWLLFDFFGIQALFINKTVDESVPGIVTSTSTAPSAKLPAGYSGPLVIADGTFEQGDSAYSIKGKATITEENGVRTLSLTDFDVSNGPDLFVYLVRASDAKNLTVKDAVGKGAFVNLGALKGNQGNQTYILPDGLELDGEYVVSIWCKRFFRNFGSAELSFRAY